MSDLIRREDVVEALYQAIRTTLPGTFTDSMSLAIAMANNLPSAEPERKKGKWMSHYDYCEKHNLLPSGLVAFWWCDQCEQEVEHPTNFCPNCGADMRE